MNKYNYLIFLINLLIFVSCHKENESVEPENGTFIDKIVFSSMKGFSNGEPVKIAVGDIYFEDNNIFKLTKIQELAEGNSAYISKNRKIISFIYFTNGRFPRIINSDGTQLKNINIPSGVTIQEAVISPDEKQLAISFYNDNDLPSGVHLGIISINDNTIKTIYQESGIVVKMDWSPDGKKIFFSWTDWLNKFNHNVNKVFAKAYLMSTNVDGTGWQCISDTANGLADDGRPSLSPDGKQIVFECNRNHPGNLFLEIYIINSDGTNIRQLTSCNPGNLHENHYDKYWLDGNPMFTQDGKYVVFSRETYTFNHSMNKYDPEIRDIYIMNVDGQNLQNMTNNGYSFFKK
jgi:hypothetical protein